MHFYPSGTLIICIRMLQLQRLPRGMEKKSTEEIFNGTLGWVEWQRPGFDLGLKLKACLDAHPGIRGILLGSHGLFSWGDTSYQSYLNTLEIIEQCADYIEKYTGKSGPVF